MILVVGYDSMLFNLSGVYGLFFICNFVILKDSVGCMGVGEVLGGESICCMFDDVWVFVVG